MEMIKKFNKDYPNGSIITQRIMVEEPGIEVFKATVTPDCDKPNRYFTAYGFSKESLIEAEDLAVIRALQALWFYS